MPQDTSRPAGVGRFIAGVVAVMVVSALFAVGSVPPSSFPGGGPPTLRTYIWYALGGAIVGPVVVVFAYLLWDLARESYRGGVTPWGSVSGEPPAATRRSGLPPSLRFQILQRDGFTCQYCGARQADGVALEVDHRTPRSLGGSDDPWNLLTACRDCNQGKSNRYIT